MTYYVIDALQGPFALKTLSREAIVEAAQLALAARGSCLEHRLGVPMVQDSDGAHVYCELGDEEALMEAVRYFQGFDVYEAYPQDDVGEFLWRAEQLGVLEQARSVVREQDPEFAAVEFGQ